MDANLVVEVALLFAKRKLRQLTPLQGKSKLFPAANFSSLLKRLLEYFIWENEEGKDSLALKREKKVPFH